MRLGIREYVRALTRRVRLALDSADELLHRAEAELGSTPEALRGGAALAELRATVHQAQRDLAAGVPVQTLTWSFQRRAEEVSRVLVADDLTRIRAELAEMPGLEKGVDDGLATLLDDPNGLQAFVRRESSPLAALGTVRGLLSAVDLDRSDEAQPVMPMATVSVTEDMATAMRLHADGWRSVYHHEVLARGLAPQDLGSALQQRLRWAQGTLQVMFRETPILKDGLSLGQRLMYVATMWSYLSGPFAIVYLVTPVLYLTFGVLPVIAYSSEFFAHLLPYLIVNQLVLLVVAWGLPTWRGQQYSLALFPLWIKALWTAIGNVYFGRSLGFVVTPKTIQRKQLSFLLIKWQLVVLATLVLSSVWALGRLVLGVATEWFPIVVNLIWVTYDLSMLSVVVEAARYTAPDTEGPGEQTAADVHGRALAGSR
jgi:cellulose synthase (UDP-forming)